MVESLIEFKKNTKQWDSILQKFNQSNRHYYLQIIYAEFRRLLVGLLKVQCSNLNCSNGMYINLYCSGIKKKWSSVSIQFKGNCEFLNMNKLSLTYSKIKKKDNYIITGKLKNKFQIMMNNSWTNEKNWHQIDTTQKKNLYIYL